MSSSHFLAMFMALGSCLVGGSASAQVALNQCGPVFKNGIISNAAECINDTTALSTGNSGTAWHYTSDSSDDASGGTTYDYRGIAFKETTDEILIVLNSNIPVEGSMVSTAENGSITYGDLMINFSGKTLKDSSLEHSLFAVRFITQNDSGAPKLGVYGNVTAKSVSLTNNGYGTYDAYDASIVGAGFTPDYGELNIGYFDGTVSYNEIDSGTFLGDITILSDSDLDLAGYDKTKFGGTVTVAFSFKKNLIIDNCGIFGGDNSSCMDCKNVTCGTTVIDPCGVCGGDGKSCLDCKGAVNGVAKIDQCGVCGGDGTSCLDCKAIPNGSATLDQCGVCGGDGKSCLDCSGKPFGTSTLDECGVCGGDGKSCSDCAGVAHGAKTLDACGVCGGDNSSCKDCKGIPNGNATVDVCGSCGGTATSPLQCITTLTDCAGVPNGKSVVDCCGICGGDGSTCLDQCTFYNIKKDKKVITKSLNELFKSVKKYSTSEINCHGNRKQALLRITIAKQIAEQSLTEVTLLTDSFKVCNTIFCTKTSLTSTISTAKISIQKLLKLSQTSQRGSIKACKQVTKIIGGGKSSASKVASSAQTALTRVPPQKCD